MMFEISNLTHDSIKSLTMTTNIPVLDPQPPKWTKFITCDCIQNMPLELFISNKYVFILEDN